MAYNQLNHLLKVKHIQQLVRDLYEDSAHLATRAAMWRILRKEKRFFAGYRTFLRYTDEPRLNERIEALRLRKGCVQLELF